MLKICSKYFCRELNDLFLDLFAKRSVQREEFRLKSQPTINHNVQDYFNLRLLNISLNHLDTGFSSRGQNDGEELA